MIEKKLILCGILAIIIGIAAIVPLEFFMTEAQATTPQNKPWFNLNAPYAYWTANTIRAPGNTTFTEAYYLALEVTTNPDSIKTLPNSRIEFYQIQVYSDQESIENWTYVVAANCTGTFNPYNTWLNGLHNYFNNSIGFASYNTLMFIPNFNGKLAAPLQTNIHDNYAVFALQGINMTGSWIAQMQDQTGAIENAHTISIDICRVGYITLEDNSTITTPADNSIIQHIELTPYNGGLLYNTVIPQNQLAQTNLLDPPITQKNP